MTKPNTMISIFSCVISLANIFIYFTLMRILDLNTNVLYEKICLLVTLYIYIYIYIYMPLSCHFISVLPTIHDMHYRLIMDLVVTSCHRSRIPVNYWHNHNGAIVPHMMHHQQTTCFHYYGRYHHNDTIDDFGTLDVYLCVMIFVILEYITQVTDILICLYYVPRSYNSHNAWHE